MWEWRQRRCCFLIRPSPRRSTVLIMHLCLYQRSLPFVRRRRIVRSSDTVGIVCRQRHANWKVYRVDPRTRTRDRRTRPPRVLEPRSRYEEVGRSSSEPVVTVPTRETSLIPRESESTYESRDVRVSPLVTSPKKSSKLLGSERRRDRGRERKEEKKEENRGPIISGRESRREPGAEREAEGKKEGRRDPADRLSLSTPHGVLGRVTSSRARVWCVAPAMDAPRATGCIARSASCASARVCVCVCVCTHRCARRAVRRGATPRDSSRVCTCTRVSSTYTRVRASVHG